MRDRFVWFEHGQGFEMYTAQSMLNKTAREFMAKSLKLTTLSVLLAMGIDNPSLLAKAQIVAEQLENVIMSARGNSE
jgi:hypothetical protein